MRWYQPVAGDRHAGHPLRLGALRLLPTLLLEKAQGPEPEVVAGIPITRHWLIPAHLRPKMFMAHPTMSTDEIRERTQQVWDKFYSLGAIWKRSSCTPTLRSRVAFLFISKLYRQMYANTGISTDSARRNRSSMWARWLAKPLQHLFHARPMPELEVPRARDNGVRNPFTVIA